MTERVNICEVGPRDGLQIAKTRMATEAKIRWIAAMAAGALDESGLPGSVVMGRPSAATGSAERNIAAALAAPARSIGICKPSRLARRPRKSGSAIM